MVRMCSMMLVPIHLNRDTSFQGIAINLGILLNYHLRCFCMRGMKNVEHMLHSISNQNGK